MMTLSEKYKEEGRTKGMCDKVYEEITADTNKDELVAKWVSNIDFAIKANFPDLDDIKRDFGDVIHDHDVYVDERVYASDKSVIVLNGACDATLTYKGGCARVYARHNSKVHVRAMGRSRVFVSAYDISEIDVFTSYFAKVFVYLYGESKVRVISGNTLVRDRKEV